MHVAEATSTNTELVAAAQDGAPDRSVLVADHQTAGRGRLDRRWDAPPASNLLMSLLLRDVPDPAVELTHRVGLAAVDAVRQVAGADARLKWPNDVLRDGRKLAGILAQRAADGSVVVGIGLNVSWAPDGAAMLGDRYQPLDVLATLLRCYDELGADIAGRYRAHLATLGQRVRVELPTGVLEGTATDVDVEGRLLVTDDAAVTHRLDVGDVVHVRPAT